MDQQQQFPREAMIAVMGDVVMYGQAVTLTVMTINPMGVPVSQWARVSPTCLTLRDGVPEIQHATPCGCAALQLVVTGA